MHDKQVKRMEKIKEIIVVEGKNDTNTLQSYFDCQTIETGGDQIKEETLEYIRKAQQTQGVIIFTDPDTPGEHIRRWINENVPNCKNAFIDKKKARTDKKVGVEHATKEDLWASLAHCVTFEKESQTLNWQDYIDFGCIGHKDLRYYVCKRFYIGPCNAKTCFKRLNQMKITKEELEKVVNEYASYCDSETNERNTR